jgi:hypothetical protein
MLPSVTMTTVTVQWTVPELHNEPPSYIYRNTLSWCGHTPSLRTIPMDDSHQTIIIIL